MKIRVFVRPPQKPSTLLEVSVSEGAATEPSSLKCFSPPPDHQAEQAEFGKTRAWAVEVPPEELAELTALTKEFRPVPFVDTRPKGFGSPVEVVISDGQAEAKMSWWLSPPTGWGPLDSLVTRLVEISQRGGSALPVELEPPDDEDDQDVSAPPPRAKKTGFFGKLMGG